MYSVRLCVTVDGVGGLKMAFENIDKMDLECLQWQNAIEFQMCISQMNYTSTSIPIIIDVIRLWFEVQ